MSINIEEERVAFEKLCKQKGISTVRTNVAMMFANGKRMGVGEYFEPAYTGFEFWIQAKQHAAEMARKGCVLQYDVAGDWWIVIPGVMRQGTYSTKEEAEQRAVREGLRIDTPKTEFLDIY